jgi:hypothetical protein
MLRQRSKRSLGSRDSLRYKIKQMRKPEIGINLFSGKIKSERDQHCASCTNWIESGVFTSDGFVCVDCSLQT